MLFFHYVQPRAGFVEPDHVVPELKEGCCEDPSQIGDFLSLGAVEIQGVVHKRKRVGDLRDRGPMPPYLPPRQEFLSSDEYMPGLLFYH